MKTKDWYLETSFYRLGNKINIQAMHGVGNDDTFITQIMSHPNSRVAIIDLSQSIC